MAAKGRVPLPSSVLYTPPFATFYPLAPVRGAQFPLPPLRFAYFANKYVVIRETMLAYCGTLPPVSWLCADLSLDLVSLKSKLSHYQKYSY